MVKRRLFALFHWLFWRNVFHQFFQRESFFFFFVRKWANFMPSTVFLLAKTFFKILRVILEFFPTMAKLTAESLRTSFGVKNEFQLNLPILTLNTLKILSIWSFVVLPIMSINTLVLIMLNFTKWTKLCLKFIQKKISSQFHFMN